jgi:hypothetical protein
VDEFKLLALEIRLGPGRLISLGVPCLELTLVKCPRFPAGFFCSILGLARYLGGRFVGKELAGRDLLVFVVC